MIMYFYIDRFKAFKEFEIYLTTFTIIAGINVSGKSNLFDALSLFSSLANGANLSDVMKQEDDFQMRLLERKLYKRLSNFVGIDVNDDRENYNFVLKLKDVDGRWYSSRVLSEGTLRILTLCVMLIDEKYQGVLCFGQYKAAFTKQLQNSVISLHFYKNSNNNYWREAQPARF